MNVMNLRAMSFWLKPIFGTSITKIVPKFFVISR